LFSSLSISLFPFFGFPFASETKSTLPFYVTKKKKDLKDFMSKAGRVTFADILKNRDGEG
jgi:hypothetical protein